LATLIVANKPPVSILPNRDFNIFGFRISRLHFTLSKQKKVTLAKLQAKEPQVVGMSGPDIRSWIHSSSAQDQDDGERDEGPSWHKDALEDWIKALDTARTRLMSSSTIMRIGFLEEEILPLVKSDGVSDSYPITTVIHAF
jgi:hypothetical protein